MFLFNWNINRQEFFVSKNSFESLTNATCRIERSFSGGGNGKKQIFGQPEPDPSFEEEIPDFRLLPPAVGDLNSSSEVSFFNTSANCNRLRHGSLLGMFSSLISNQ